MLKKGLPVLALTGLLLLAFPMVVAAQGGQPPADAPRYGSGTFSGGRGGWMGGGVSLVEATATATGEDVADIVAALQDGQSYAEIADAAGITLQDIVDVMVAARAEALKAAVAEGRFTQEQADTMLASMEAHLLDQLNETWTAGGTGTRYGGSTQLGSGSMRGRGGRGSQTDRPMYRYDPENCPAR